MGMRIKTNVESLNAQRNLQSNQNSLNSSMEKLSSGSRINKSADDAAGLAISETLRAKERGLGQAKRNANDGVSMVQVAESAMNEMSNNLIRMRELTVQAASDTIGEKERSYLQKEYSQLSSEIDRISQNTEFNGTHLLNGETSDKTIQVQVGYNGTESDVLGITFGEDGGITAETLEIADTNIDGDDREAIAENLEKLDNALTSVANNRANLGAMQSRLNSAITSISVSSENMAAANSRIRDVDFAEETAKLTQSRILSSSSISVLSQANQKPEMALSLLR